ncbi:MAG: hypothetical protein HC897_07050 [Thermoanaerobaculia bacterium]|nr:hypothetical protein [Thermoanaerobaculia bacterium]
MTVVPGLADFQLPASELRLKARPLGVDPGKGLSELEASFTATPGAAKAGTQLSLRSGVAWELALEAAGLWAEPAIIFSRSHTPRSA